LQKPRPDGAWRGKKMKLEYRDQKDSSIMLPGHGLCLKADEEVALNFVSKVSDRAVDK
jgi:hypothetical protein